MRSSLRKDIIPPSQIGNFLKARVGEQGSTRIYSSLKQGDLVLFGDRVRFSSGTKNVYYRIDDLSVTDWHTGQAGKGLPLCAIFQKFDHQESRERGQFVLNNRHEDGLNSKVYRYSDIVATGKGVCIEKAIMLQLVAQKHYESYLIGGMVKREGEGNAVKHAFNVVVIEGQPYLIDLSNPQEVNESGVVVRPYFVPILGLKLTEDNYEFVLPPHSGNRQTYSLNDQVLPYQN